MITNKNEDMCKENNRKLLRRVSVIFNKATWKSEETLSAAYY